MPRPWQSAGHQERVANLYEEGNYAAAMREIMAAADAANEFIEAEKPWTLAKDPEQAERLHAVCSNGLLTFWELVLMLGPVLPSLLRDVCKLFSQDEASWDSDIIGATVGKFEHLMKRVDAKAVKAMVEETASSHSETAQDKPVAKPNYENKAWDGEDCAEVIQFDDFMKVDLRVAEVLQAEAIKGSNKLLKLTVGLGGDITRTILAGIAQSYKPEDLQGRLIVVVANLAPRKMKLGTSEGMAIAAGPGGKNIFLLSPDSGALPGMRLC